MAKQSTPVAIPSLTDVDAEYKDLVDREGALNTRLSEIRREISEVEAAIAAEKNKDGPRLRAAIAELVGDADAAAVDRRKHLRDLRHAEHDHEEALAEIQRRVYARRSHASHAVIVAVQGELNNRKAAIALATESALAVARDLEAFLRDLESEGVETNGLRGNIMPFFLTTGQAERYVAEHKDAGRG